MKSIITTVKVALILLITVGVGLFCLSLVDLISVDTALDTAQTVLAVVLVCTLGSMAVSAIVSFRSSGSSEDGPD